MINKTTFQFLLIIFIVTFLLYPKIVLSLTQDAYHDDMYNCDKTDYTYDTGSAFQLALNDTLFSKLPAKASKEKFANVTNGTGIDQVNALFYCRGDVGAFVCRDCVIAVVDKITKRCKLMKEAVGWSEDCTVRYSNRSIFSIDEETPFFIYTNSSGIVNDNLLSPFNDEFYSAMNDLIQQVAYTASLQGFSTTQVNLSSSSFLHCVAQCTPNIIGVPCDRCLRSALKLRDKWADTMIFTPSCFIRVDLYSSTHQLAISPGSHHGKQVVVRTVLIIVASIIVGVMILVAVVYYYYQNRPILEGIEGLRVFTHAELSKATNRFKKENVLGKGGFGEVFRGKIRRDGLDIAVKRLNKGTYQGNQEFLSEMRHNSLAENTNVVSLLGYCSKRGDKMLVYEFMPRTCLHNNLHGHNANPIELTPEIRMKIALGTAKGLKYLHEECRPKIIHRDVKSANILLSFEFEPKVADFGLAKIFADDVSRVITEVKGTPSYLDPEYIHSKQLTEKSDVYSFGIVLLELITGLRSTILLGSERTKRLLEALRKSRFSNFIDSKLRIEENQIDQIELFSRMMICAALCLHPMAKCRLKMSQVVKILEAGSLAASDLANVIPYARSDPESSRASTGHQSDTYNLEKLRLLAIQLHENGNQVATLQRTTLESGSSNILSNPTSSYKSMDDDNSADYIVSLGV